MSAIQQGFLIGFEVRERTLEGLIMAVLGLFWDYFGVILGAIFRFFWGYYWVLLGLFWGSFGAILGYFEGQCCGNVS